MGRIIGYQYDDNVQDGDAWIGSEDGGGRTKQYTAEAVANYLNIQGKISIVGQMTYKYVVTPLSGVGTFAVFGGGTDPVAFSAITKLTLSNTDVSKQRVVEFLNLLVGSDILISKQSAISTFGYYSIDNYAVNATDPAYYDLGVTFKSGNGSMEAEQIYETQNFTLAAEENISTLQTTIDSGNTYQASPSDALWTWGTKTITVTSTPFTSFLSSKRFRTTLITDGSYTDILPNQINFNTATGNVTSITTNTALSSNIDLQLPSSSGTLALTSDITASPWDTVLGGISYAGGNVGIGTTNPGEKLEVNGGIVGKTIFIENGANWRAKLISDDLTANKTFQFPDANGTIALTSDIPAASQWDDVTGGINYASGNVGIGTDSPGSKLQVQGDIRTNTQVIFTGAGNIVNSSNNLDINSVSNSLFSIGGSEKMRITSTGNVGIGTTSPSEKLEVAGNIRVQDEGEIYIQGSTSTRKIVRLDNTNDKGLITLDRSDETKVSISSDFTTHGHTYFNGLNVNVGIGTTSPTSKLEVAGGDIELSDVAGGITMISPDGTRYRITVANGGTLTVTAV